MLGFISRRLCRLGLFERLDILGMAVESVHHSHRWLARHLLY